MSIEWSHTCEKVAWCLVKYKLTTITILLMKMWITWVEQLISRNCPYSVYRPWTGISESSHTSRKGILGVELSRYTGWKQEKSSCWGIQVVLYSWSMGHMPVLWDGGSVGRETGKIGRGESWSALGSRWQGKGYILKAVGTRGVSRWSQHGKVKKGNDIHTSTEHLLS